MKQIYRLDKSLLPPKGLEYRMAHYLLGPELESRIARAVLEDLIGHPKRFRDLVPLVAPRSQNHLTRVLAWLRENGLIQTLADPQEAKDILLYELNQLGALVLYKMAAFEELRRASTRLGDAAGGPVVA